MPHSHGTRPGRLHSSPIDAEYLDRLVATRLVENVLTNENLQTVIKIIQEQCGEKSLRHRAELETISDRLAVQNRPRRGLMAAVETERATFAEVAGQVQELNDAKTRLEAQAIEAKKQLDIQEFVSDEGRIRESAQEHRHLSRGSGQGNRPGNASDTHPGSAGWAGRSDPALHHSHAVRWTGKVSYDRGSCPQPKYIESEPEVLPNAPTNGNILRTIGMTTGGVVQTPPRTGLYLYPGSLNPVSNRRPPTNGDRPGPSRGITATSLVPPPTRG